MCLLIFFFHFTSAVSPGVYGGHSCHSPIGGQTTHKLSSDELYLSLLGVWHHGAMILLSEVLEQEI